MKAQNRRCAWGSCNLHHRDKLCALCVLCSSKLKSNWRLEAVSRNNFYTNRLGSASAWFSNNACGAEHGDREVKETEIILEFCFAQLNDSPSHQSVRCCCWFVWSTFSITISLHEISMLSVLPSADTTDLKCQLRTCGCLRAHLLFHPCIWILKQPRQPFTARATFNLKIAVELYCSNKSHTESQRIIQT